MNDRNDCIAVVVGNVPKKNMNIIPYVNSLEYDERIEFLDKLITSALKTGHELCFLKQRIVCDLFDENILGNLDLYFSVLSEKFWSRLKNEHNDPSSLEVKKTRTIIQRALAKFAVEKINMLYALPIRKGGRLPMHRAFCIKSQQELLENIARMWVYESTVDGSKQYMNTLISSAMNEIGDMVPNAIREANRDLVTTTEKIVQAIEMCREAFQKEPIEQAQQRQIKALIQTLSISWIKSLSPYEVLEYMKK